MKRSRFVFLTIDDSPVFDLVAFLRGRLEFAPDGEISAISPISSSRRKITADELRLLARTSARRWTPCSELLEATGAELESVESLAAAGFLLSDEEGEPHARWRQRDEALNAQQWHPYAALFHFMTWRPVDEPVSSESEDEKPEFDVERLAGQSRELAEHFVERHGRPPAPIHRLDVEGAIELPDAAASGQLFDVLLRRRSVRAFDLERQLRLVDFARLLRYVFGAQGQVRLSEEVLLLKKTSPSGGSLHPIEVFPLVLQVEDVAPGLYHYDVGSHALEPIRRLELEQARRLAVRMASGQTFAGSAHALFFLCARFFRNFWKYRRSSRAYGVVLMDAGHLSQTFYLVATELGLGAFYTAAIDAPVTEQAFGLDGFELSPIGCCGCGVRVEDGPDLGLDFAAFDRR